MVKPNTTDDQYSDVYGLTQAELEDLEFEADIINQDWVEATRKMFAGYTIYVYYGSSLKLNIKSAKHLPSSFTARTIIITSPGTFYSQLFKKTYLPIVFTDSDGDIEIGDIEDDPTDADMMIVKGGQTVQPEDATEWRRNKKRVYEQDVAPRNYKEASRHTATHVLIQYK
ncbi:unnamed protein product [Clonostachys solani]|uniref:Uncharacterized protein n=1 Tax=Clonostachys solani TaxID=160281 RepID=A0A9N9Z7W0_9HYPO|nr:unnamed protein product [Clonostachys solani]